MFRVYLDIVWLVVLVLASGAVGYVIGRKR
jgi:hypothetical protein